VCDELKGYLDPQRLFKAWRDEQLKMDYRAYTKMKNFILLVDDDPLTMKKILRVNFDPYHVELFKEVGSS
jgi:hypothetical protein